MVRVAWDVDGEGARTGVLVVTLDRPERRNAVDHATLLALLEAQAAAAAARALVLTGAPPAFCAGADLTGVEEGEFARALSRVLRGFTALPIPTVAAVDGPALGAGTQLVVACDLRVATPASRFGVPAARLGLVVDHWTVERLARELDVAGRPGDAARRRDLRRARRCTGSGRCSGWARSTTPSPGPAISPRWPR